MDRRYITAAEQRQIIERAGKCCEYCKCPMDYASQPFSLEHIIPISEGGKTSLDNLALACGGCNGHKYTKTKAQDPISRAMVPLFNPREQIWHEHFAWSEDYLRVVGLSQMGRATVNALKLNRLGVLNLRRLLLLAGIHPPSKSDA